jgi:hypothetical protein
MTDKEFDKSNQMFLVMKKEIKREGPEAIANMNSYNADSSDNQ